jgi:hypothetical protein
LLAAGPGAGRSLDITAYRQTDFPANVALSTSSHLITLTATEQVTIFVAYKVYLPNIQR